MASEWTFHTGGQGQTDSIHIDWSDHNNVRQRTELQIVIRPQDKPRTLEIWVNGVVVATVPSPA